MKVKNLIEKRRSIRNYQNKKVSNKLIKEIIRLANLAPTAASEQNRYFIVIKDKKIKNKIYKAGCQQEYINKAPVIIIVATNILKKNELWEMDFWGVKTNNYQKNKRFGKNWNIWKKLWPIQDADTATTTLLLATAKKGLGTCWLGCFDQEKIGQIIKLPKNYLITALITLGYPKKPVYPQKRKNIDQLLSWNQW